MSKAGKQSKKQSTVPKKPAVRVRAPKPKLIPCSSAACRYAEALLYPERDLLEVSLPVNSLALPSWKIRTMSTISWGTGSGGCGFVSVNPAQCIIAGSTGIVYSSNAFQATTISGNSATGCANGTVISPVASMANYQYRVVTCGVTTECTTPGLNRGGLIGQTVNANHETLFSLGIANQLVSSPYSSWKSFGTEKLHHKALYGGPVNESELSFQDAPVGLNQPFAVWAVSSQPQSFVSTIVCYLEIVGGTLSNMTPSQSAPQQASILTSVVQDELGSNPGHEPIDESMLSKLRKRMSDGLREVGFELAMTGVTAATGYGVYSAQRLRSR
jgi:hypothetical protein